MPSHISAKLVLVEVERIRNSSRQLHKDSVPIDVFELEAKPMPPELKTHYDSIPVLRELQKLLSEGRRVSLSEIGNRFKLGDAEKTNLKVTSWSTLLQHPAVQHYLDATLVSPSQVKATHLGQPNQTCWSYN